MKKHKRASECSFADANVCISFQFFFPFLFSFHLSASLTLHPLFTSHHTQEALCISPNVWSLTLKQCYVGRERENIYYRNVMNKVREKT